MLNVFKDGQLVAEIDVWQNPNKGRSYHPTNVCYGFHIVGDAEHYGQVYSSLRDCLYWLNDRLIHQQFKKHASLFLDEKESSEFL